eukprot:scaffold162536_cov39-Prasinocladus_malaysianus.AAC.1
MSGILAREQLGESKLELSGLYIHSILIDYISMQKPHPGSNCGHLSQTIMLPPLPNAHPNRAATPYLYEHEFTVIGPAGRPHPKPRQPCSFPPQAMRCPPRLRAIVWRPPMAT